MTTTKPTVKMFPPLSEPALHAAGYTRANAGPICVIAWEPQGGPTKAECYIRTGTPGCTDGRVLCTIWNHANDRAEACRTVFQRGIEEIEAEFTPAQIARMARAR